MNDQEKISNSEMSEALFRSGYLLESRLLRQLSDLDYQLHPNDVYPDPLTGKSREIDILGISKREFKNLQLDRKLQIEIQHELILECSNNPQPIVFFKRTDKRRLSIYGKFKFNKVEQIINEEDENPIDFEFDTFTTENQNFHYNKYNRCTQYCSFSPKKSSGVNKKEWFASHPDGLNDVLNKLYDFVNHRYQLKADYFEAGYRKDEVNLHLYFPVIVFQGDLYEALEKDGELTLTKSDHTVFEFSRYDNNSNALLIDVVTEKHFPEYLKTIKADIKSFMSLYSKHYKGKTLLPKFEREQEELRNDNIYASPDIFKKIESENDDLPF